MSTNPEVRAWLDVDAGALLSNYAHMRQAVGSAVRMLPMVKADAYGLGVAKVAALLERSADPWAFGVATVEEGIRLRELGVTRPVVVFSPAPPGARCDAVRAGLTLSVGDLDAVRAIAACCVRLGTSCDVHLEVDTGMGRSGVDWRACEDWLPRFQDEVRSVAVRWRGLYTHLHSAENDEESVWSQEARFARWIEAVGPLREGLVCHSLNSAGVLRAPELARDAVRPGIFLYGGACGTELPAPQAVVSLRARVVHVRDVLPGTTVGYGATHTAETRERWATLSIGYGDGLPRALGNRGYALIHGVRVPIVGRVSMDVTVVNITGVDGVGVGDVATLIGRDGSLEITVDEVSAQADTISYEVLTGFTPRLPRVWEHVDG
ncbi:MAG: alanine racemase [Gemmatimonadota bacterium]